MRYHVSTKDITAMGFTQVRQIDAKQLFTAYSAVYNCRVLISYKTIIGKCINNQWLITTERYSPTTSKQITQFINRTKFPVIRVDSL